MTANAVVQGVVGLLVTPGLPDWLSESFADDLRDALRERHPDLDWRVPVVRDVLVQPPADDDDLVDAARDRLLELD